MPAPAIRAVFFDAVGTLIYPEPNAADVYTAVGRRFGSRRTTEVIAPRFRIAFQAEEALDRQNELRTDEDREVQRWRRIVAAVLDDVSDAAACFQELFAHFSRPQAWACLPDVAVTLLELARRGYTLGLASNYDQRLRSVAAGLAPLQLLQHLIISSEVGWRKPAPGFFDALSRSVKLSASQILLVGDDWDNDYKGARAAGLEAVLFDPSNKAASTPATRITRLSDLL